MYHVIRTKWTEAKLKKAFRLKLLQLCQTRTKKSSPDLFNFFVALVGHDKVTDADRATSCWRKIKGSWLRTKDQKMKDLPKISFTEKLFEDFRRKKKQKFHSWHGEQNKKNHGTRKAKTEFKPTQVGRNMLKQKWKNYSDWICWNFARPEIRSHVLTCSTFM